MTTRRRVLLGATAIGSTGLSVPALAQRIIELRW
jgi:hypothetical protein